MTSPSGKQALGYAARGWRVFPLHGIHAGRCTCGRADCPSPGKHPLSRRGLHDATTDLEAIEGWWRQWRRANIGLVTGAQSGFVVVDIDLPTAFASLDAVLSNGLLLPRTLCCLTGGGGVHLFYASHDVGLRNSAGSLPGHPADLPGIDLRANGGYVAAPPSTHARGTPYSWAWPRRRMAPVPEWLRQPIPRTVPKAIVRPAEFEGDGSAYGLAVLRDELERLRRAKVGSRNHQLNRSAFALARLVAGGELHETAASAALLESAIAVGLSKAETRQTINSAFKAGVRQPRCAPHRVRS